MILLVCEWMLAYWFDVCGLVVNSVVLVLLLCVLFEGGL